MLTLRSIRHRWALPLAVFGAGAGPLLSVADPAGGAVVYSGGEHTFGPGTYLDVVLEDDPYGPQTIAYVLPGAQFRGHFRAHGHSRAEFTGGTVSAYVWGEGFSRLDVRDVHIDGYIALHDESEADLRDNFVMLYLAAYDRSVLRVFSGRTDGFWRAAGNSRMEVYGGVADSYLRADGDATIVFHKGEVCGYVRAEDRSRIELLGGQLGTDGGQLWVEDQATVVLSGAAVSGPAELSGSGELIVYGGDLVIGPRLRLADTAAATIHGSDFNHPLGPVADLSGVVSGRFADGKSFSWDFERAEEARLVLVPEASSMALLMLCAAGFAHRRPRPTKPSTSGGRPPVPRG